MDSSHFDAFIRTLAGSRRSVLGGALALAGGWLGVSRTEATNKKRRKKKGKKPKPNEFGCLSVGKVCKSADQCCAGICEGRKGQKTCRNHGAGTCLQEAPGFCVEGASAICDNSSTCVCTRTTAGSNFCGTLSAPSECASCQTDADCEAQGFPPGSACAPFATGYCGGNCESGMVCLAPCDAELPGA